MFVETQGYQGNNNGNRCRCCRYGLLVLICWVVVVLILIFVNELVAAIAIIYFPSINLVTLVLNLVDKLMAKVECCCRVPECVLHFLSLVGGAPATALSMFIFNHKLTKALYQDKYVHMCLLNISGLVMVTLRIFYFGKSKNWLSSSIKEDL